MPAEITLLWLVERYSYHGLAKGRVLRSPPFYPKGVNGTKFRLWLYPRGSDKAERGLLSLHVIRYLAGGRRCSLPVRCEFSILTEDGSVLASREFEQPFAEDELYGEDNFLRMEESMYWRHFPRDLLTVRCTIGKGEVDRAPPVCFRTTIGIETISYRHDVENFPSLRQDEQHSVRIPSHLEADRFVASSVYFTRDGRLRLDVTPPASEYILCTRRVSVLGCANLNGENPVIFSEGDNRFDVAGEDITRLPLPVTREDIVEPNGAYLPDGRLCLLCECSFNTGRRCFRAEKYEELRILQDLERRDHSYPGALEDLRTLYVKQSLTDVQLKTESNSFPAHKCVLCARSPVFHRMLSSDMWERNNNIIQVDDLEDDVVHRFLLFLYSDGVQDLEWTVASRLYYAADKYQVEKLRAVCSSFLLEHLSPHSAGELLLLADTHGDSELKGVVEDYILEHEEEVFGSDEWDRLLERNPALAGKTMQLKYKRKKSQ